MIVTFLFYIQSRCWISWENLWLFIGPAVGIIAVSLNTRKNNEMSRSVRKCTSWHVRLMKKRVREKSKECHNHKPQPFPDIKRKRKPTNPNKHKSIKHTKSTTISSLFPKRGNRNAKRTEKHKNKMAQDKTYNESPRRINHKAPKGKTNTVTTAFERSVE